MSQILKIGSVSLLLLLLGACQGTGGLRGDIPDGGVDDGAPMDGGVDVTPLDEDCKPPCAFERSALQDPAGPLSDRLVFFEFDSAEIRPEFEEMLIAHAQYLASYPDVSIRLEGHTDERGSREYNLALGEQRAKSVRRILLLEGAPEENISIVSFGEELPLDLGHDEAAWSQNRRVELVYEEL